MGKLHWTVAAKVVDYDPLRRRGWVGFRNEGGGGGRLPFYSNSLGPDLLEEVKSASAPLNRHKKVPMPEEDYERTLVEIRDLLRGPLLMELKIDSRGRYAVVSRSMRRSTRATPAGDE